MTVLFPEVAGAVKELIGHMHQGVATYETGRVTDVDPSNVETRDDFARFVLAVLADLRLAGEAE